MYHLHATPGTRKGGQSAGAKVAYIERDGKYARGRDPVLHVESGNMPAFAADDHKVYWRAADLYEPSNAVLYREVEFALPREMTLDQQKALAREFAESLTGEKRMPYTLAIHAGGGGNPHCHLVISEREQLDGIERDEKQFFKKHLPKMIERGGTKKADIGGERRVWLSETRERWQDVANAALEKAGFDKRIDHRSLAAQGITDRLPGRHIGIAANSYERRLESMNKPEQSRRRADLHVEQLVANARLQEAAAEGARELAEARAQQSRIITEIGTLERERAAAAAMAEQKAPVPQAEPKAPAIDQGTTIAAAVAERDAAKAAPVPKVDTPSPAPAAKPGQADLVKSTAKLSGADAFMAARKAELAAEPVPKVDTPKSPGAALIGTYHEYQAWLGTVQEKPSNLTFSQHERAKAEYVAQAVEQAKLAYVERESAPARAQLAQVKAEIREKRPEIDKADSDARRREREALRAAEQHTSKAAELDRGADQWLKDHSIKARLRQTQPADDLRADAADERAKAAKAQQEALEARAEIEAASGRARALQQRERDAEREVEAAERKGAGEAQRNEWQTKNRADDAYKQANPEYRAELGERRVKAEAEAQEREAERQAQREAQGQGRSM